MSITMLWCFWVAVGLGALGWILLFGIAIDAHIKVEVYREELSKDMRRRSEYVSDNLYKQSNAVNDLECKLQAIKDLL